MIKKLARLEPKEKVGDWENRMKIYLFEMKYKNKQPREKWTFLWKSRCCLTLSLIQIFIVIINKILQHT